MNTRLLEIQEMLMREMKRIDNESLSCKEVQTEVSRSNALTNGAITFIKTVNIGIRVKELAEKTGNTISGINKELGIEQDDKKKD